MLLLLFEHGVAWDIWLQFQLGANTEVTPWGLARGWSHCEVGTGDESFYFYFFLILNTMRLQGFKEMHTAKLASAEVY